MLRTLCPHCKAPCALPDDAAGKAYRCGKCKETFRFKPTSSAIKPAPLRTAPKPPPPRTVRQARRPRPRTGLYVGVAASVVLLVGAVVAIVLIVRRSSHEERSTSTEVVEQRRGSNATPNVNVPAVIQAPKETPKPADQRPKPRPSEIPPDIANPPQPAPIPKEAVVIGFEPAADNPDSAAFRIPQHPAQLRQSLVERLAWIRKTFSESYHQAGQKDPKWDELAFSTLDKMARHFSDAEMTRILHEAIFADAKKAIELGCDDPLILYVYANTSTGPNHPGPEEYLNRHVVAARALENSKYPVVRRMIAVQKAGLMLLTRPGPAARKEALHFVDELVQLLLLSAEEDEPCRELEDNWCSAGFALIEAHGLLLGDRKAGSDKVDELLLKSPRLNAVRLQIRCNFFIHYAWEARGSGTADTVSKVAFQTFGERLVEARKLGVQAWEANPSPRIATMMININKGLLGDREDMEMWFTRAMKLDGAHKNACSAKLDWLDPKWHGTLEEMLGFGRACRDTRNWQSMIPLLGAEAHHRAAYRQPTTKDRDTYLMSVEYWNDVNEVYTTYLRHRPQDSHVRSNFVSFCIECGRLQHVAAQFEIIGNRFDPDKNLFNVEFLKSYRAKNYPETDPTLTAQMEYKQTNLRQYTVALEGQQVEPVVGAGGRLFIFWSRVTNIVTVVDVVQHKIVKTIPINEPDVVLEAGQDVLIVVRNRSRKIERWSLDKLERESEADLPVDGMVFKLALGPRARGKALMIWSEGPKYWEAVCRYGWLDTQTLKSSPVDAEFHRRRPIDNIEVFSTVDGSLHAIAKVGANAPRDLLFLNGDQCKVLFTKNMIGRVYPSAFGHFLVSDGIYTPQLEKVDGPYYVHLQPALEGDYYLKLETTGKAVVYTYPALKPVGALRVNGLETTTPFPAHLFFLPESGRMVTLNARNDRLTIEEWQPASVGK